MNKSKIRLDEINRYLADSKLDAIIAMNLRTASYLTNFKRFDHYTFQNNLYTNFPVFTKSSGSWWVGGKLAEYLPKSMRPSWIDEFYDNDSSVFEDNIEYLVEILQRNGLSRARIGLDYDSVPVIAMNIFQAGLPDVEFVDSSVFFKQLKAVKTAKEIRILQAALDALEAGYQRVLKEVRSGRPMSEVMALYGQAVEAHGTQNMPSRWTSNPWEWVANDSIPNDNSMFSREKILKIATLERINTLGYRSGYWSDNGIMLSVGDPGQEVRMQADQQWRVMDVIVREIKPGMSAKDAYQACQEAIDREVGYQGAWDCHSIGVDVMEDPWIGIGSERRESDEITFEPNTVICIEAGSGAEQTFVMGSEKLHRMSKMPQKLHIVDA